MTTYVDRFNAVINFAIEQGIEASIFLNAWRHGDTQEWPEFSPIAPKFTLADHVRKTKGSQWQGRIVGTYSTELTPEGYAVESEAHPGSVQIYPASALELVL